MQKSGDQIRVTAQLIDATTDNHLLSRKYDRKFADLFALEDDLTLQIASALNVHLSGRVDAQIIARGTRNLEAWETAVKAFQSFELLTPAGMEDAVKLGEHAIDLDRITPSHCWIWRTHIFCRQITAGQRTDRRRLSAQVNSTTRPSRSTRSSRPHIGCAPP